MLSRVLILIVLLTSSSCVPNYSVVIRDKNKNFIPDNIESWITSKAEDKNQLKALSQLAFAYSMMLNHASEEKLFKKWLAERDLASLCVRFVFSKSTLGRGLDLTMELSNEFKKNLFLRYLFWRGYNHMESGTYTIKSKELIELGLACNFQIDNPQLIYDQYKLRRFEVISDDDKKRLKELYDKDSRPVDIYKLFGIGY